MYNDMITLVAITETPDDTGDLVESVTKRTIFAQTRSIGMKEKYMAFSNGLNPEMTFIIADYLDYSGEQFVEYGVDGDGNPVRYRVLRTFRKDEAAPLEIVVTR